MSKKKLLVLDQSNAFLRAFIVDPSISKNGDPIGGLQGSLKILQKLMRDIQPDHIIICWDGPGGSRKRKEINGSYKEGRKPIRLNRAVKVEITEQQEFENKVWQMTRLSEYYDEMPIMQFLLDDVEADDIIAYVCQVSEYEDWRKIVVSSDKDFVQCLDNKTILFRPVQKEILNANDVVEKYGIHPLNFALARSMAGDKSDNIDGIRGVGLGTVAKRLPFLREAKSYTISDVVKHCNKSIEGKKSPPKAYTSIISERKKVEKNYKLMQLYSPSISIKGKSFIRRTIQNFEPSFNKTRFRQMMMKDGFGDWNWDTLFQIFNRIVDNRIVAK